MAHNREYTPEKTPRHALIKPLVAKGYTNIKLVWHTALSHNHVRGWVLECDQIPWKRIGYDLKTSMQFIKNLERCPLEKT